MGEDFGCWGCAVVIALFLAFAFAGMRIAVSCPDRHGCLLAAGLTAMITVQAFINIGVVVGVLPTTGLPLPFFSAGGYLHLPADGGDGHHSERVAHDAQMRLFFTLGQA